MRLLQRIAFVTAGLGLFSALPGQQAVVRGTGQTLVWAPMPVQPNEWIAPNRPIARISEMRAKHAGEKNWTETVVSDGLFHGDYISMAPGAKTPKRFHPDNRAWWIVQDGQIRRAAIDVPVAATWGSDGDARTTGGPVVRSV